MQVRQFARWAYTLGLLGVAGVTAVRCGAVFWAEEEESLLASLDSDQPLQASEEEAIYKRLAQIDALRQRYEEERAAFEKRAAARAARNAARAAAVGWAELRAGTVDGVEAHQRVLRSAAFVAGARQAGAVLSN